MSLVPGKDKCPKCGSNPLLYEASKSNGAGSTEAICSKCKTPARELEAMTKLENGMDAISQAFIIFFIQSGGWVVKSDLVDKGDVRLVVNPLDYDELVKGNIPTTKIFPAHENDGQTA
jgi:hypothetical protein